MRSRHRVVLVLSLACVAALVLRGKRDATPATTASPTADDDAHTRISQAYSLPPLSSFTGGVLDPRGAPIAGALVCAACARCQLSQLPTSACTRSDAQGRYELRVQDVRGAVISAVADGYALGFAHGGMPLAARAEPRADLDIVLQPGGAWAKGTVVDALGGPVARARVIAERVDGSVRSLFEATSDDDGNFAFPTSEGVVTLHAELEGYAPANQVVVAPVLDVELQLVPESVVRGRVVEARSGEPITGVEVLALPGGLSAVAPAATTDEDGAFSLHGLEPGEYQLLATHERARGASEGLLQVHLADVIEGVVIQAVPAVRVLGHVRFAAQADAEPCPRGIIELRASDLSLGLSFGAPVEADGTARITGVLPGSYEARVECLDRVLAEGPLQVQVEDHDLELSWTVRAGLAVSLAVVDDARRPVPFAHVMMSSTDPAQPNVQIARSFEADAQGRVEVSAQLQPGSYTFEADEQLGAEPLVVTLRAGDAPLQATLRLPGSATLEVEAKDTRGAAVGGLIVSASARSDDANKPAPVRARELGSGRYQIGPVKPGDYEVRVEDGTNASPSDGKPVQLLAGVTAKLPVSIQRGGKISGVVVDASGAPEPNAWVSAIAEGEAPSIYAQVEADLQPPRRVLTDSDGRFQLGGLAPRARYAVKAKQPYANATLFHDVAEGSDVRIVLPSSAVVTGTLLDPEGKPVRHAQVTVQHDDTHTTRAASVHDDGTFTIEHVPVGTVVLQSGHPRFGMARQQLELSAGQRADVRLTFTTFEQLRPPPPDDPTRGS